MTSSLPLPAKTTGAVRCRVERWPDALPEMERLFPLHWRELAVNQHAIKIDLDREKYANLDRQDMVHLVTARSGTCLIGYAIAFIMPHMHYKSAGPMAMTDMYFILPEFRHGAGVKLFREFERSLRARGIRQAITSCKLHQDHTQLFEKLGWTWTDKTFVKLLS